MTEDRAPGQPIVVLHAVPSWLPQTETWLYNQIRFLPNNVENHVFAEQLENLEWFPMSNLHVLPGWPSIRGTWERGLRRLGIRKHLASIDRTIHASCAQLIHSHFGPVGWGNAELADRRGLPHVTTFYGMDVQFLPRRDPRWIERYQAMFSQLDAILCEGPHMKGRIVEMGCPDNKVLVHHLGVALDEIPFRARRWRSGEPLKVLIAASFREKKGIPFALEALSQLRRIVPLEVTIIGDANAEPRNQQEKRNILSTIQKTGLGGVVRMLGYQPSRVLFEEAYRHHVYLAPSVTAVDGDTEGGAPVALIEMLATGMMVVSTNHCDIPEVLAHGAVGLMAAERDLEGLYSRLLQLVDAPEAWEARATAGRAHVQEQFDAKVQGLRLARQYADLLAKRP